MHYAPGHARHHVLYHDPASGDAYTGDVAGVSVPPSDLAAAPTPPPEIEVEVWLESLQMLRSLEPKRICMTHFGWKDDAEGQIARVEAWLKDAAEESSHEDPDRFAEWLHARFDAEGRRDRRAPAPGDAAGPALAGTGALLEKAPRDRVGRKRLSGGRLGRVHCARPHLRRFRRVSHL